MRRAAALLVCMGVSMGMASPVAALEVFVEPLQAGLLRLDAVYTERAGLEGRNTTHWALGAALGHRSWQLGATLGRAASSTDFGLLEDPNVRLELIDATAEVRWRAPVGLAGWQLQAAAGLGRLVLRYHPDSVALSAGGETLVVSLDATHAWTRHVAAELLHAVHGNAWIALRGSGSFYSLNVASPTGPERTSMRDVQFALALRLRLH